MRISLSILFLVSVIFSVSAQKVGVVLSGGGSSGMAHIGVLKALEENNIPIDYITGTSMGALVGGMYAIGWSPVEIEQVMTSEKFRNWAEGIIEDKYQYYFKRKETNASWISFKFSPDTVFQTSLPTNLISPLAIDFAMMEIFAAPTAAAKNNFDSLMVPFRCMASDIEDKKSIRFKSGYLNQAIRSSMSYPFYIKPIMVDGKVLFDGGLYNNFPADVLYDDFKPDYIIGSNVSGNQPHPDDDNLIYQIKNMVIAKSNYQPIIKNTIYINPNTDDMGVFNFSSPREIIETGYKTAYQLMDSIKSMIPVRVSKDELLQKRKRFKDKMPNLLFDNIETRGLNKGQSKYVKQIIRHRLRKGDDRVLDIKELKPRYFRLASDDKIKDIYPLAIYNTQTDLFDLQLSIKKEKKLTVEFGGVFSSKPINTGYVGLQYNYMGRTAFSFSANSYFGKLYGSSQAILRLDFPFRIPLYSEFSFTNNRYDFFKSYATFFEDVRPSYLIQNETFTELAFGVPVFRKGKIKVVGGLMDITNNYYQTQQFSRLDTADKTYFEAATAYLSYERNSLNRKVYANTGSLFSIKIRYVNGYEKFIAGSTSKTPSNVKTYRDWVLFKMVHQNYLFRRSFYKVGYHLEGVYSTQTLFDNYKSSILMSPGFMPTPESRTLFLDNFRTQKFAAIGLMNVFKLPRSFDWRVEAYVYQPYQKIVPNEQLQAIYNNVFINRYYVGSTALVYNSPIGPAALSFNYYNNSANFDKTLDKYSLIFTFGYIIHNKRALD